MNKVPAYKQKAVNIRREMQSISEKVEKLKQRSLKLTKQKDQAVAISM